MTGVREKERLLRKAAEALRTEPEQLPAMIRKFRNELEEARRDAGRLRNELEKRQ